MRILELYLRAYGPFTEQRIDLSGSNHKLCVIFGKNESGKSSALRALKHLLYGIPMRSTDDFLHGYSQMRIGGRLRHSDNSEIAFFRKKGSKNTLRSYDDTETLEDHVLERFLGSVSEEFFTRFFGIDHQVLVEGGQSLLDYRGEIGKSLYAAGLGSVNLRNVLSSLETEATDLFKPSGSRPRINAGIASLRETKERIKRNSLKGKDWKELDRALAKTERELTIAERELAKHRALQVKLDRLGSALPILARRRQLIGELQGIGTVVMLEDSFEGRLRTALETRRSASENRTNADQARDELTAKISELRLDAGFLQHREEIELFRERLGSYKKTSKDLPQREGERERLSNQLTAELFALRPDLTIERLDELIAPLRRRRQIQELANEHGALLERVEGARKALRAGKNKKDHSRRKLDGLPERRDISDLRRAIKAARSLGDIDERTRKLSRRCELANQECQNAMKALRLWSGTLDELELLAVPGMETIERFEMEFEALRKAGDKIDELKQIASSRIRDINVQLENLRKSGAVPTEADLATNRDRRDAGWRLVRRRWIENEAVDDEIESFAGGEPLADLYERSVSVADDIADRLRSEADRVALQAELVTQRERFEEDIDVAAEKLVQLERRESALGERWRSEWTGAGLAPNPPREMLGWLRRQQKLVDEAVSTRREKDELRALLELRTTCRKDLITALDALEEPVDEKGAEVAAELSQAEKTLQSIEKLETERMELANSIEEAERALKEGRAQEKEALNRLTSWLEEWSTAVDGCSVASTRFGNC